MIDKRRERYFYFFYILWYFIIQGCSSPLLAFQRIRSFAEDDYLTEMQRLKPIVKLLLLPWRMFRASPFFSATIQVIYNKDTLYHVPGLNHPHRLLIPLINPTFQKERFFQLLSETAAFLNSAIINVLSQLLCINNSQFCISDLFILRSYYTLLLNLWCWYIHMT